MKSLSHYLIDGATLSAQQRNAFRSTSYTVRLPRRLKLQAGIRNSELSQLLRMQGAATAAVITACNPAGCPLPATKNKARHAALATSIKELKLKSLPAERQAGNDDDASDEAFLILNISSAQAEALLMEFDQYALLWCNQSTPPELMLHPRIRQRG